MIPWNDQPTPPVAPAPRAPLQAPRPQPINTEPARKPIRNGLVRGLGVAITALVLANGVVIVEQTTERDLAGLISDGFGNARDALARAVDPDDSEQVLSGSIDAPADSTTTTTAAATTSTTVAPAAAGDPNSTTTTAPPTESTTTTARKATAKPAASAPAKGQSIEEAVAQLSAWVQTERRLPFKTPVTIVRQEEKAFKASLAAMRIDPAVEEARRVQGVYKALGIIEPGIDLPAQVRRLSTGTAPAYYDYKTDRLVVKDAEVTPFVRKILVHELTNALNDQHFDIDRPALRTATDDSGDAFDAIVEGISSRLEARYVASLSDSERQSIQSEQQRLGAQLPRDVPQVLLVNFAFPFSAGARLADALGDSRIDQALQAPPATTELVVHPEKYTGGEQAKAVAEPAADGAVVRSGSLGQLLMSLMFAQILEGGYAEAAADGWGGDRYVAWEQGGQTCVRMNIDMDSPEENAELGEALTDWAAELPGATITGTGPFTVSRCA